MRRLVLFLFIVNGLIFAWFTFQQDKQSQESSAAQEQFDFESVEKVVLLSEVAKSELLSRNKERLEQERRRKEAAAKQICYLIGPMPDANVANKMRIRMDYPDTVKVVKQEMPLPDVFKVYIEPQATYQAAKSLEKRLIKDGFDSYAEPNGDDANAVALGVFSKRESAEGVAAKANEKGYEVQIAERKRTKEQFFVALGEAETADFEDVLLDKVRPEVPEVKIEEKACKGLALLPSIQ